MADLSDENDATNKSQKDTQNQDFFHIPLIEIVSFNSDRKILVHAAMMKLQPHEQHDERLYAYEFGCAYNLHLQENNQIKEIVSLFLN